MKDGISFSEGKNCDITKFVGEVMHQNLKRKQVGGEKNESKSSVCNHFHLSKDQ